VPGDLILMVLLGMTIEGETSCPTPQEVAVELRPLLPEEFSDPERRLILSVDKGQVVLTLTSGGGEVLAKRILSSEKSCPGKARRVAVIAAAWQAQLSDEPLPPPPAIESIETSVDATEPERTEPGPRYGLRADLGLRLVASKITSWIPTPLQLMFSAGHSWGRVGFIATVTFPVPEAMLGPTYIVMDGPPSIGIRAQAIASLGSSDPGGLIVSPGIQGAIRMSLAREGTRAFFDLAFEHYFIAGGFPPPNAIVFAGGVSFGGT
jgi:hypothetical protein